MSAITINNIIEEVNQLPFQDIEYLSEIINKQLIEKKRDELCHRSKEAFANYKAGKIKKGNYNDLLKDLEND